ncbi:hypothetical protein C1708_08565 [Streptomyces sp. DH-12]|nr:hypothetical protein C1708_08565 [Streptomyces sp. DH-12]
MRGADAGQGAGVCDPRFPPCASSPPSRRAEPARRPGRPQVPGTRRADGRWADKAPTSKSG